MPISVARRLSVPFEYVHLLYNGSIFFFGLYAILKLHQPGLGTLEIVHSPECKPATILTSTVLLADYVETPERMLAARSLFFGLFNSSRRYQQVAKRAAAERARPLFFSILRVGF